MNFLKKRRSPKIFLINFQRFPPAGPLFSCRPQALEIKEYIFIEIFFEEIFQFFNLWSQRVIENEIDETGHTLAVQRKRIWKSLLETFSSLWIGPRRERDSCGPIHRREEGFQY